MVITPGVVLNVGGRANMGDLNLNLVETDGSLSCDGVEDDKW